VGWHWGGGRHGWRIGCLVGLGRRWGRAAGVSDWQGSKVKFLGRIQGGKVCRL